MSRYKEQPVTLHHITEYGNDTGYFENKLFELRIGDEVIGRGDTIEEAIRYCETANDISKDITEEVSE